MSNSEDDKFDNKRILEEISELYGYVSSKITKYAESDKVNDILRQLEEISTKRRNYEKSKGQTDKDSLIEALNAARSANAKMKKLEESLGARAHDALAQATARSKEAREWIVSSIIGVAFLYFIIWGGLHAIALIPFVKLPNYIDTFFVAFLGAFASSIFTIGDIKKKINSREILAKLTASPFVAVVLVMVFSEYSVGFQDITSAANQTEIVNFTLQGASDGLRMAFAFIFGFFGETSVTLLKRLSQPDQTESQK